jgi:DNA replication and repair protein RecF
VILQSLTTENFRNLQPAEHAFHPAANIVVGRNGHGKTNLLEAIYFLATTKSFRTSHVQSLVRFGAPSVFVGGAVERGNVTRNVTVGIELGEPRRRVLMINGEPVTLATYLNALTVFAYSAMRLETIRGAPEERRRFLDRGIASINPGYLEQLTRYGRVLKQRNALLHAISIGDDKARSLDAWDEPFTAAASAVQSARAAYAEELAAAFGRIVAEHNYHLRGIEMIYRPSVGNLWELRKHEVRARLSIVGPQRDGLEFLVDGRPAAEVLSGGELKTIVLFLKFAKLDLFRRRYDEPPLFVLDDLDAELDLDILQKLLAKLPRSTQVFASSAKESFLQALETGPHRRLALENGRVTTATDFP